MADTPPLSPPPTLAWQSMPREFVNWFILSWKSLTQSVAAIQGANVQIGSLTGTVNLTTTNLSTLQTQANTISAAQVADAANITALQARATTDEALISGCLVKANNLSDLTNPATARTNLGFGSGFSGTVTIAKLTTGGTNGALTFSNGLLTSKVDPT